MRALTKMVDETRAHMFGDYLYARGIANQVEPDPAGGWTVYVHSDDHMALARQELEAFLVNPGAPVYAEAQRTARRLRGQETREDIESAKKQIHARRYWQRTPPGYLTLGLIGASILVTYYSDMGLNREVTDRIFIASEQSPPGSFLPEVFRGEVWRLFSPMFLHLSILHILFNMLWLYDLGSMVERRQSLQHLAILVVVLGLTSNLAQYLWSGPAFGGMSGVVYGLFGYVWLRGRFDPGSGLHAPPSSVPVMLVWLVLCMTGWLGPIGNASHLIGLVLGAAWGFVSAKWPLMTGRLGRGG
jgi:GlpG protein